MELWLPDWGCDVGKGVTLGTTKLGCPGQRDITSLPTPGFADEKSERMLVQGLIRSQGQSQGKNQGLLMSSPEVGDLPLQEAPASQLGFLNLVFCLSLELRPHKNYPSCTAPSTDLA